MIFATEHRRNDVISIHLGAPRSTQAHPEQPVEAGAEKLQRQGGLTPSSRPTVAEVEERWRQDELSVTVKLVWLFVRYNGLRLCGVIEPGPYLKPKGLVATAFIFTETRQGRYIGERLWMPPVEGGRE